MRKVLFLVYRAGWWGCFDQLYREHKADADCQCTVVVLPRYDRNSETLAINYERYQYDAGSMPRDVEVTDFRKYSVAQERPDVIYIHNPHDNSNILDAVPPEYFSQNLKQYTDKLVYVHHTIGFTEKVLQSPVYQYVDKIYIATEKERYAFPVELDHKLEVVYPGIIPYITDQWQRRPAPRKGEPVSLFVYIDFNDLYYGTDRLLRKLEQVLGYLKGRRDFRVTLHSDRELLEHYFELQGEVVTEYNRIVQWYVDERIGDYDTEDNDCLAAVKHDVLVTFGGKPIGNMFSVLGKMWYQLNQVCIPLPTEDDLCMPNFRDCAVEGDEVTFVADTLKLLCRMDLKTGKVKVLGEVPDEVDEAVNYIDIYKADNLYFLLPYMSDGLVIYDEDNHRFEKKYFPAAARENFTKMLSYGQYLYFFPSFYRGILRYDTINETWYIYDAWVQEMDQLAEEQDMQEPYFIWGIRQEGKLVHMASAKASVIMHFDMETGDYSFERLEIPDGKFIDMEWDNGNALLLPYKDSKIFYYCSENRKCHMVHEEPKYEAPNIPYARSVFIGETVVVLPHQSDNVLYCKKDISLIKERRYDVPCGQGAYRSEYMKKRKIGYQIAKKIGEEKVITYEQYTGAIRILTEDMQVLKEIKCRLTLAEILLGYKQLCGRVRRKRQCFNAIGEWYPIPVMLEYVKSIGQDRELQRENALNCLVKNYGM